MKNRLPLLPLTLLGGVLFLVFLGQFLWGLSPYELDKNAILLGPSPDHPFGTDRLGRDVLARVIEGGKISVVIGAGSALIGSFIGLMVGITAGFFRGTVDKFTVAVIDLFLTFPTFFLLLALVSYVEATAWVLIAVISVTGWMGTARMIRSEAFAVGEKPFIKILKIAGVGRLKILLKYFAPLLAPIFLISFTFGVSGAILAESGLSFLGLGVNSPDMSWGTILAEGKALIDIAWWVSFFPGLFIFLVTFSLVQLSDWLQHLMNRKEVVQ